MNFNKYVLCFTLIGGYMEYSHAMNPDDETHTAAELQKKHDKEIARIIRSEEMPRMLAAIQNNDFPTLKMCAERLIFAHEYETLDMALAAAIVCNNLHFVRYLVEVGFVKQKANVPRAIILLIESRGVKWYVESKEGEEHCVILSPIVHYLSHHFNIPFDIP